MSNAQRNGETQLNSSLSPVALWLRALGTLGDSEKVQGRAVKKLETFLTNSMERLTSQERFLTQVGAMMERSFLLRAQANRTFEETLHTLRMPTTTDLVEVYGALQHLDDKVEALGFQMDLILSKLEEMDTSISSIQSSPTKTTPRRRRVKKA